MAHVPRAVKTITEARVVPNKATGDRYKERADHIAVANKSPAVPGPHGQKPLPNPEPIIIGNSGALFIS